MELFWRHDDRREGESEWAARHFTALIHPTTVKSNDNFIEPSSSFSLLIHKSNVRLVHSNLAQKISNIGNDSLFYPSKSRGGHGQSLKMRVACLTSVVVGSCTLTPLTHLPVPSLACELAALEPNRLRCHLKRRNEDRLANICAGRMTGNPIQQLKYVHATLMNGQ